MNANSREAAKMRTHFSFYTVLYRVFRTQADWTFILTLEFLAKELRHLPRKMPPRGTMY
jgi:hypothetical protein